MSIQTSSTPLTAPMKDSVCPHKETRVPFQKIAQKLKPSQRSSSASSLGGPRGADAGPVPSPGDVAEEVAARMKPSFAELLSIALLTLQPWNNNGKNLVSCENGSQEIVGCENVGSKRLSIAMLAYYVNWHGLEQRVSSSRLGRTMEALKQSVQVQVAKPAPAPAPPATGALEALRDKLEQKLEVERERHQGLSTCL